MERNFKDDVAINRFKLAVENEQHSSNYLYWSEHLAEAKAKHDRICTRLKLRKAEKQLYYRNNPLEGHKVSVDSIKSMVDQDDDILELRNKRTEAQKAVDILFGVIHAMADKKGGLDNLTKLSISGYYSRPGTKGKEGIDSENNQRDHLNKKDKEE